MANSHEIKVVNELFVRSSIIIEINLDIIWAF